MVLDENDDDGRRYWRSGPVLTIEQALQAGASDDSWVAFFPVTVHPEYRTAVWELAQAAAGRLPKEGGEMRGRRRRDWRQRWRRGP